MFEITFKKIAGKEIQLDLYLPQKTNTRVPLVILFHGGGWKTGSRKVDGNLLLQYILSGFLQSSIAVISADYRHVTPDTKDNCFPIPVIDAMDVVRWAIKNSETYGFDTERFSVVGGSAGGHLALMTGFASYEPMFKSDCPEFSNILFDISVVVDLCGPAIFDKAAFDNISPSAFSLDSTNAIATFIGEKYNDNPELYEAASPATYIGKKEKNPRVIIFHGNHDDIVPLDQSERLHKKLKDEGILADLTIVDGGKHDFTPANETQEITPSQSELISCPLQKSHRLNNSYTVIAKYITKLKLLADISKIMDRNQFFAPSKMRILN